jgi:NAD-dependent dihydropyrimidine dehydrogenase PreA subunit
MISATNQSTCTVVVSRGQSRNPQKRALEQAITEAAAQLDGVDVLVVPHLYDLPKASESYRKLAAIEGDIVLVSWIYSRAAHWVLDRNGIQGQVGEVTLGNETPAEEHVGEEDTQTEASDPTEVVDRLVDLYPRPERSIYSIDLKVSNQADAFIDEIRRLVGIDGESPLSLPVIGGKIVQVDETTSRRWYPVIDFSRCTNCMECVDFCLFGVYGVDGVENILVEQPDNCRKGCPACSRVCPENAIIFPQHKAPAIAGAQIEGDEGFKIDLSQLFGAPADGDDAIATAARERDEQLLLAGRDAVGIDEKLRKRQADRAAEPKDKLDRLLDSLDEFDL